MRTRPILHEVSQRFTLRAYMKLQSAVNAGLRSTIVLRVIISTILLGSGALVYYLRGASTEALYLVAILSLVYILSLLYLLLRHYLEHYPGFFQATQIAFDILLVSLVVFVTGGRSSPFIFLYVLIIIYASVFLTKIASYVTAVVSGLIYIFIVYYQTSLELPADSGALAAANSIWRESGLVSTYFHLTGFLLIAVLGGYLSDRIRSTGRELGESERLSGCSRTSMKIYSRA